MLGHQPLCLHRRGKPDRGPSPRSCPMAGWDCQGRVLRGGIQLLNLAKQVSIGCQMIVARQGSLATTKYCTPIDRAGEMQEEGVDLRSSIVRPASARSKTCRTDVQRSRSPSNVFLMQAIQVRANYTRRARGVQRDNGSVGRQSGILAKATYGHVPLVSVCPLNRHDIGYLCHLFLMQAIHCRGNDFRGARGVQRDNGSVGRQSGILAKATYGHVPLVLMSWMGRHESG